MASRGSRVTICRSRASESRVPGVMFQVCGTRRATAIHSMTLAVGHLAVPPHALPHSAITKHQAPISTLKFEVQNSKPKTRCVLRARRVRILGRDSKCQVIGNADGEDQAGRDR